MKAYKAMCHDMTCRGFKYETGKTYEMSVDDIEICRKGFHACQKMVDVYEHYPIASRVFEVEIDIDMDSDRAISHSIDQLNNPPKSVICAEPDAGFKFTEEQFFSN